MATNREVIGQIQYALQRLSSRNGFHDFEHIARHWARSEVCKNLVPATGPVSAGGDGGADFETHSVDASVASVGMGEVQGEPTAFCCSIEKGVAPKAKSDLRAVAAHARGFKRAFVITIHDLAIGSRLKLVGWAKKELNLDVEVIDGTALSEALAQPHLFWIAQEDLSIPAEIYPTQDTEPWYVETRAAPPAGIEAFSSFWVAKRAIRYATRHAKHDVLFWVQLLEKARMASTDPDLSVRLLYEEIVGRLRGLGTLHGHEDLVRSFLFSFDRGSLALLGDASVLATYSVGSVPANESNFKMDEALGFVRSVESIAEGILSEAVDPEGRCELLQILLFLVFLREDEDRVERAFSLLDSLLKSLRDAPLFPRRSLIEWMDIAGHRILSEEKFNEVNDKLDRLTAEREGQAAAAANCTKRATRRLKGGDYVGAVRELHRAKIQWRSGEARSQALRACLLISHCYSQLGLWEAAKHYALATLDLSLRSEQEEALRVSVDAGFELASCEHARGNWVGSALLVRQACGLAAQFRLNATDLNANEDIRVAFYGVAVSLYLAKRFAPQAEQVLRRTADEGGFLKLIDGVIATNGPWKAMSDEALWALAGSGLDGQPFDDVERAREIRWCALGVDMRIKVRNERRAVAAAEGLAAACQVVMAAAAKYDLRIARGAVVIDVESVPGGGFHAARQSMSRLIWSAKIGRDWTGLKGDRLSLEDVCLALDILFSLSLLPTSEVDRLTNELLHDGLVASVFIARPFVELWERWVGKAGVPDVLPSLARQARPSVPPKERPALAWRRGPLGAPHPSLQEIRAAVQRRYDRAFGVLVQTLPRLRRSPEFLELVRCLRSEGWRDWHILSAVFQVVANWRLRKFDVPVSHEEAREHGRRMMDLQESLDDEEVPLDLLTSEEGLRFARDLFILSMLRPLGLANRQTQPDVRSVEEFLRERASFDLDVDHPDPFGPP